MSSPESSAAGDAEAGSGSRRDPIWVREAARGQKRQPLTRERIVSTAVAVADDDGLAAVSIRRIAAELEARPMSLYAHFESKDDLLELMYDAVAHEALIADELPVDWREALRLIARHTRAATLRHPWMVEGFGNRPRLGPAMLRHLDQSVAAIRGLPVDEAARNALIRAVDTFTLGHVMAEMAGGTSRRSADASAADADRALAQYIQAQIDTGDLPHLADADVAGLLRLSEDEASFEQGLDWLLAGFAAALKLT